MRARERSHTQLQPPLFPRIKHPPEGGWETLKSRQIPGEVMNSLEDKLNMFILHAVMGYLPRAHFSFASMEPKATKELARNRSRALKKAVYTARTNQLSGVRYYQMQGELSRKGDAFNDENKRVRVTEPFAIIVSRDRAGSVAQTGPDEVFDDDWWE